MLNIEREIEKINRDYSAALEKQYSSHKQAALDIRSLLEHISTKVYVVKVQKAPKIKRDVNGKMKWISPSLFEMIGLLQHIGVHEHIITSMHDIRMLANILIHHDFDKPAQVSQDKMHRCLKNLDNVKEWYINALYEKDFTSGENVRYRKIQIHTDLPETRFFLQNAQKELGVILDLGYRENTEPLSHDSFLTLCQEFAATEDENKLLHLFVFTSAGRSLESQILETNKAYKSWGNNVFSMIAPPFTHNESEQSTEKKSYEHVQPFFNTIEKIGASFPPVAYERTRRIDAAAPKSVLVHHPFDLFIQARFVDDPMLGTELWPEEPKSRIEQRSESLDILFPINEKTKRPEIATIYIKVETEDFHVVGGAEKKLDIPPETRSETVVYQLVPKRQGACRLKIFIHQAQEILIRQIPYDLNVVSDKSMSDDNQHVKSVTLKVEAQEAESNSSESLWRTLFGSFRKLNKQNRTFLKSDQNQNIILEAATPIVIKLGENISESQLKYLPTLIESMQKGMGRHSAVEVRLGLGGDRDNPQAKLLLAAVVAATSILGTLDAMPKKNRINNLLKAKQPVISKVHLIHSLSFEDVAIILKQYNIDIPESDIQELLNALVTVIGELYDRNEQANQELDA